MHSVRDAVPPPLAIAVQTIYGLHSKERYTCTPRALQDRMLHVWVQQNRDTGSIATKHHCCQSRQLRSNASHLGTQRTLSQGHDWSHALLVLKAHTSCLCCALQLCEHYASRTGHGPCLAEGVGRSRVVGLSQAPDGKQRCDSAPYSPANLRPPAGLMPGASLALAAERSAASVEARKPR